MRSTFYQITAGSFLLLLGCQNHTYVYGPGMSPNTSLPIPAALPLPPLKRDISSEQFTLEKPAMPETLSELIDLALIHNPKTQLSWQRVRAAKARKGKAQSSYYPDVNFHGSIGREKTPSATTKTSFYQSLYQASVDMSYTLLDFGGRKWKNENASALLRSARHMHEQVFQDVIQQVKTDYFDFLYQVALKKARIEDKQTARLAFEIADAKYEGGVGDRSDIAVAKTQYCATISKLTEQEYRVQTAYSRLIADIGFPFETKLNLQSFEDRPDVEREIKSAESLVALAMHKRPDLKSLQDRVNAGKANVNYQRAQNYPKFSAHASVGENYTTSPLHFADSSFSARVELSFPLFSGFYYRNKTKEAQANMRFAKASLEEKEIEIIRTVLDAQNGVQSAADRYRSTRDFLDAAMSSYEITLSKYRAGTVPLLNLSQAISALADARSDHIEATKDWYVFLTDLGYATGILSAQMLDEMPVDLIQYPKKAPPYE